MKILVITYSHEVNPGTFLQAFGVQYALKKMFPTSHIEFINHERIYTLLGEWKGRTGKKDFNFIKSKFFAIPRRLKYEYYYKKIFSFTKEKFDFFNYDRQAFKKIAEKYDLIVVGSDTILIKLQENSCVGLMWLCDIDTNKVLFAASAAPASFEVPLELKSIIQKSFDNFKFLGVRDRITYELLDKQMAVSSKITLQPDPTYLIPSCCFSLPFYLRKKLIKICKDKKVVLVNFGDGFLYKKEITIWLQEKGYFVISTLFNPYANKNLMTLSPFEWAAVYQYVDFSITERFHDSVFTLRNNKPVIAVDWLKSRISANGFSKTRSLLETYDLSIFHHVVQNRDELNSLYETVSKIEQLDTMLIKRVNMEIRDCYTDCLQELHQILLK